jgi:hypothetical protein
MVYGALYTARPLGLALPYFNRSLISDLSTHPPSARGLQVVTHSAILFLHFIILLITCYRAHTLQMPSRNFLVSTVSLWLPGPIFCTTLFSNTKRNFSQLRVLPNFPCQFLSPKCSTFVLYEYHCRYIAGVASYTSFGNRTTVGKLGKGHTLMK